MSRQKSAIRKIVLLIVFFGLSMLFYACSPRKAPITYYSQNPAAPIRTVWAEDFATGQLEAHYLKHRNEFGDITMEEYLNSARILLNSAANRDILEKVRDNGDILRYRVSTGEFAVMAGDGRIRTYFKADYQYWLKQ